MTIFIALLSTPRPLACRRTDIIWRFHVNCSQEDANGQCSCSISGEEMFGKILTFTHLLILTIRIMFGNPFLLLSPPPFIFGILRVLMVFAFVEGDGRRAVDDRALHQSSRVSNDVIFIFANRPVDSIYECLHLGQFLYAMPKSIFLRVRYLFKLREVARAVHPLGEHVF